MQKSKLSFLNLFICLGLIALTMSSCPQSCMDCDSSETTCFACDSTYELSVFGKCHEAKEKNCILYGPENACFVCEPSYKAENGKCIKDFTGCVSHNSIDGSCFQCSFNRQIQNGQCIKVMNCEIPSETCKACLPGYRLENNLCVSVQKNCANVRSQDGLCSECNTGYKIQGFECIAEEQLIPYCYLTTPSKICTFCKSGFSFYKGKCRLPKEIQSMMSGSSQQNSQQNTFTGQSENIHSSGGFSSDSGFAQESSPDFFTTENSASSGNSFTSQGYNSGAPNTLPEVSQTIANCLLESKKKCIQCDSGYVPDSEGQCIILSTRCISYDLSIGRCIACEEFYLLKDNQCIDIHCEKSFEEKCLKCQGRYQISNNGACLSQGCLEYSEGKCIRCSQGYQLDLIHFCQEIPSVPVSPIKVEEPPKQEPSDVENCQVLNPAIPGKCLICLYGWYPYGNQCLVVSKTCDGHDVSNGNCFQCKFGLELIDGKCVDKNCIDLTQNGLCQSCKNGYSLNSVGICEYLDENCKEKSAGSRCNQCNDGYYVNVENGRCKDLPFGCKFANILNGDCLECRQGHKFKTLGVCEQEIKIENCNVVNPENPKQCLICIFGYFPFADKCLLVSKLCKEHDVSNGNCFSCVSSQYQLIDGKCYDPNCANQDQDICLQCKKYYIMNDGSLICQFDDPNCQQIEDNACKQCKNGFYIYMDNGCSKLRENCVRASMNGNCEVCQGNYNVVNGYCQAPHIRSEIPVPSYQPIPSYKSYEKDSSHSSGNSGKQLDPNCMKYSNGICIQCSNNFFFNSDKMCEPVNALCKGSDSNGLCLDCYSGYSLNSGKCIISLPKDQYCKRPKANGCEECYQSYFIDQNGSCKRVNVLCKTSNSFGDCVTCYPGYQISQGTCKVFFKDPNCKRYNNGICEQCSDRHYLNSNEKCTPVDSLCKKYNVQDGKCTECYRGYGLKDGQCIAGLTDKNSDPNCKSSNGDQCNQCYKGYYVKNGKCTEISKLCKKASQVTGECLDCYPGYSLVSGQCILSSQVQDKDSNCKKTMKNVANRCEQCYSGFYPGTDGICQTLDPLCKTHNLQNGNCLSCYPGYSIENGECVTGNSGSQTPSDPYCTKHQNGVCIKCANGYFLKEKCEQANPLCKTFNLQTGDCLSCYSGYVLANGSCFMAQQVLIPYCQIPGSQGLCQECIHGYYANNGACKPVSILCGDYDKISGKCLSCIPGYVLQRGGCLYPALGYDANCEQYSGAYCGSCVRGFYLENYFCKAIDGRCMDFDRKYRQCKLCANGMTPMGAQCV